MPKVYPEYKSAPFLKKLDKPILTVDDMPYEAGLIFNAGVTKVDGKYIMVFRNDYGTTPERYHQDGGFNHTTVGVAESENGVDGWIVRDYHLFDSAVTQAETNRDIRRFYDPRITQIDDKIYLTLAADARVGIQGCIAEVDREFRNTRMISMSVPNNRNMVLFPEKVGGYYYRLERPMAVFGTDSECCDIWVSRSPDLVHWGDSECILRTGNIAFANSKVGPASPPIKTEKGWLATYHGVDFAPDRGKNGWERKWESRYSAGIMLLDLDDPRKVVAWSSKPLIAPELPYETDEGFRQNVIVPGAMILEDDGEVKIYYGASDTCECLATAHVDDLINYCFE